MKTDYEPPFTMKVSVTFKPCVDVIIDGKVRGVPMGFYAAIVDKDGFQFTYGLNNQLFQTAEEVLAAWGERGRFEGEPR